MGTLSETADQVWRDFEVEGQPESGSHKPVKAEIRELFGIIETPGSLALNSVADLTGNSDLSIGMFVETTGYYSAGDGGGAVYEIVAGGTGVDDGAFFINLANGRQAKLILSDPKTVRVKQLGAVADGVFDD